MSLRDGVAALLGSSALLRTLRLALHRAAWDWPYRIRLVQSFALIDAAEAGWQPLDLFEIRLAAQEIAVTSHSVAFTPAGHPAEIGVFELDAPLGNLAERCTDWRAAATPLLFAGNACGDAVLQGPDLCLVGHVVAWTEQSALGSDPGR
jgi:hypothetical protein